MSSVYPRVCGGTPHCLSGSEWCSGLSPRVRGNPRQNCRLSPFRGLSPRVRGNHAPTGIIAGHRRSIPACAGEPGAGIGEGAAHPVYPRVCGGTWSTKTDGAPRRGLSPRVRGNQQHGVVGRQRGRSIPACAGEPESRAERNALRRVYPRVCGGTQNSASGARGKNGLSPRVRGNRGDSRHHAGEIGSIPACAGEPYPAGRAGGFIEVYPRVCGGTSRRGGGGILAGGLSPRVRGNPRQPDSSIPQSGSIPACAGEPPGHSPDYRRTRVYPRVCGGTCRPIPCPRLRRGLSPRVRGNQGGMFHADDGNRSIPACAGEPHGAA